ncbi:hypothetical protein D3C72_1423670 [compost metagenome]
MPGIERHVNQAGLLDRENALDRLGRVVEQHSDALPNLQPKGNQGMGKTVAARLDLVIGQAVLAEDQGGAAPVLLGCPTEHESCGAFFCHDFLSYCRQPDTALGSVVPPCGLFQVIQCGLMGSVDQLDHHVRGNRTAVLLERFDQLAPMVGGSLATLR